MLWARIWDDTKKGIDWIEDMPGVSPGRWAVGYNYLYVMTRILDEIKPNRVLDLGLGISSTLISNYFKHQEFTEAKHLVVEQSKEWADFYIQKNRISPFTEVFITECVSKEHQEISYNAYKNIGGVF